MLQNTGNHHCGNDLCIFGFIRLIAGLFFRLDPLLNREVGSYNTNSLSIFLAHLTASVTAFFPRYSPSNTSSAKASS